MVEHTPDSSVSRRSVLKTAGGLLAGGTLLSGQAAANLAQSGSAWAGEYSGRLDGREARLTIKFDDASSLLVILEDLDRNVAFSGETSVPTGGTDHVIRNLRLDSSDGQHKTIERLYRHGFDADHISGYTRWRGTNYGLAFASDGIDASAGNGSRLDSNDWADQWEYTYRGRNDGRNADLYIRVLEETDTTVRFFVGLYDRQRGNYFKGETEKDRNSTSHIMSDLTLQTADGSKQKTIDRLYLHTWDTHYVSGRTEWNGNYYGLHFAREY